MSSFALELLRPLLAVAALAGCLGPTTATVTVATDVPCTLNAPVVVTVAHDDQALAQRASAGSFSTVRAGCVDGTVGTVTLTPAGSSDETFAFAVMTRTDGTAAETCQSDSNNHDDRAKTCIIARRTGRFSPHHTIDFQVHLASKCAGVPCDASTTCEEGVCVDSSLACLQAGDCVAADAGGDAGSEAGVDDAASSVLSVPLACGGDLGVGIGNWACAVRPDGGVGCWGDNSFGELGDGTVGGMHTTPTPVNVGGPVAALAAGGQVTCALLRSGDARCWGFDNQNHYGNLGNGTTNSSAVPVTVTGLSTGVSLAVGGYHACVALADGTANCWGAGNNGALGSGTSASSSTPTPAVGLIGLVAIAAHTYDSAGVAGDGSVWVWGSSLTGSTVPLRQPGVGTARALSVGRGHVCVILASAQVACWGTNDFGQLGRGATGDLDGGAGTPAVVLDNAIAVAAADRHTCALHGDGTVDCWGDGSHGELGMIAPDAGVIPSPTKVSGVTGAIAVSAGNGYTCAMLGDRSVLCWGDNTYGELGDGTMSSRAVPMPVKNLP